MASLSNDRLRRLHQQFLDAAERFPSLHFAAAISPSKTSDWPETHSEDGYFLGLQESVWKKIPNREPGTFIILINSAWLRFDGQLWQGSYFSDGPWDAAKAHLLCMEEAVKEFERLADIAVGHFDMQPSPTPCLHFPLESKPSHRWLETVIGMDFITTDDATRCGYFVREVSGDIFIASARSIENLGNTDRCANGDDSLPAEEKVSVYEYIGRTIGLLEKAEALRLKVQKQVNALSPGVYSSAVTSHSDGFMKLKLQFDQWARPLVLVAYKKDIDAAPLDNFIRTGEPSLVADSMQVLRRLQAHTLKSPALPPTAKMETPKGTGFGRNPADLIEQLLAGPHDPELTPRELARLEAYLSIPANRPTPQELADGNSRWSKLKQIQRFNRNLQADLAKPEPIGKAGATTLPSVKAEQGESITVQSEVLSFVRMVDGCIEDFREWKRILGLATESVKNKEPDSLSLHKMAADYHSKSDASREAVLEVAEVLPAILEQAGEDSRPLPAFIKALRGRSGLADSRIPEMWEPLRVDLEQFAIRQGLPQVALAELESSGGDRLWILLDDCIGRLGDDPGTVMFDKKPEYEGGLNIESINNEAARVGLGPVFRLCTEEDGRYLEVNHPDGRKQPIKWLRWHTTLSARHWTKEKVERTYFGHFQPWAKLAKASKWPNW